MNGTIQKNSPLHLYFLLQLYEVNDEVIFPERVDRTVFFRALQHMLSGYMEFYAWALLNSEVMILCSPKASCQTAPTSFTREPFNQRLVVCLKDYENYLRRHYSLSVTLNREMVHMEDAGSRQLAGVVTTLHTLPLLKGFTSQLDNGIDTSYPWVLSGYHGNHRGDRVIQWFGTRQDYIQTHQRAVKKYVGTNC